jgi:hypothetical protein
MPDLLQTLRDHDNGIYPTLAQVWGVTITNLKQEEIIKALHHAMTQPERAEIVWDTLDDAQRGALQSLLSNNRSQAFSLFSRLYGDIRQMGKGRIEREKPHKNPESIAEALFYRGLIATHFVQNKKKKDTVRMVYVPDDLAVVLPVHKTAYQNIAEAPADDTGDAAVMVLDEADLRGVRQADTSIVDDMTTLLAYLRINTAGVEEDTILPGDVERLSPYLIDPNDIRLNFMLAVGISAGLITTQEGRAYPKKSGLQAWLNRPRSQQIKALLDAWHTSTFYRDLWHVPGLFPDTDAGFPYDPLIGREAMREFVQQFAPAQEWWSIDEFIAMVRATDPDFQRPDGDYDSWYIRNADGEYLKGFKSWDAIDGALLDFYLQAPMHWLGLVDVSENAARLTAYGRAYVSQTSWPAPPEASERIDVLDDGILKASRKVARVDRFQLARFTTWGRDVPPYFYKLDAEGIKAADAQGITTQHIAAFIQRQLDGQALPPTIAQLLDTWQGGAASDVTIETLKVLRTTSPEVMSRLYDEPAFRRYLGAKLGPMACIVRDGQADALREALGTAGINVELLG